MASINELFNNDKFKNKSFSEQREYMLNYFDAELASDKFKKYPESEQQDIRNNFVMKELINIGAVKPREDGAGFLTRTKFSFTDTDAEKKQVLEDEYGKGNAYKYGDRWMINEGGKKGFNYVDENKLSWKDTTADIAGDIPEVLGGALGGTAGAIGVGGVSLGVGAVPGATVGMTVGTGAGRSTKDIIKSLWGIDLRDDNSSFVDKTLTKGKRALESGLIGGISDGLANKAGDIGKWGIDKVTKPFANKMTPEAIARRELAQQYGIDLTPAQVTQSPMLSRIENMLNSGITGSSISDIKNGQFETLQGHLNNTFNGITKGKTNEEIGLDIAKMLDDSMKLKKADFNQKYGDLASKIDKNIPVDELKLKAQEIIGRNEQVPKSLQGQSVGTAQELSMLPENIDYNTFSQIRSGLGEKARAGGVTGDIGTGQYKQLKSAMDNSFDNYSVNNGLGVEKQNLDSFYRAFKNDYESGIVNKILKDQNSGNILPENVGNNTVSSITNTKRVSEALGGNNEPIQEALASKLMNKSSVSNPSIESPFSNYFSANKLNSEIGKNKDTFEYAFSDAQKNKINDLAKIGNDISLADKVYGNPSGTSKALDTVMSSGLMYADPAMGTANLAGRYLGAKGYVSDVGKKYLTDGFDVSGSGISKVIANQPVRQSGFYEALKSAYDNKVNQD